MAQDMQWPSEDEDFDAVVGAAPTNNKDVKPAAAQRVAPVESTSKPARAVSVAVDEPEDEQPEVDPVEAAFAEDEVEQVPEAPEPIPAVAPQEQVLREEKPLTDNPVAASVAPEVAQRKKSNSAARTVFEAVLVIALLCFGYFTYTLYNDNQNLQNEVSSLNANPQLAVQRQTDKLISDVAALMTLPQGETPTVANVSDATKAKQQSTFFANAQNGDKVLMYVKAGQAILYRPSTNKIVLVAPLTFNNSTAATSSSKTTTTPTTTKPQPR